MPEFIEVYDNKYADKRGWLNIDAIETFGIKQNGEIIASTINDTIYLVTGTDIMSLQDLIQQASKKIDETPPTMTNNRPF